MRTRVSFFVRFAGVVLALVPALAVSACGGFGKPTPALTPSEKKIQAQKVCTGPVTVNGSSLELDDTQVTVVNVIRDKCNSPPADYHPTQVTSHTATNTREGITADGCLLPALNQAGDHRRDPLCFRKISSRNAALDANRQPGDVNGFFLVRSGDGQVTFKDNDPPSMFLWTIFSNQSDSGRRDFIYIRATQPFAYQVVAARDEPKCGQEQDPDPKLWFVQKVGSALQLVYFGTLKSLRTKPGVNARVMEPVDKKLRTTLLFWDDFRKVTTNC